MKSFKRRPAAVAVFAVVGLAAYVGCQVAPSRQSRPARFAPAASPSSPYAGASVAPAPLSEPQAQLPATTAPVVLSADAIPLRIIEVGGTAEEIGTEHGQQLSASIRTLLEQYLKKFIKGDVQRFVALAAAQKFDAQLLPEHREEIAALAKGAGVDPREVMLGQCFLDLTAMVACSTITLPAEASPDGVARFGRNLDFPSLDVADKYSTLFVYRPQGRYAFASVAWPGMIGVLSGMNEHGLSIANMEVTRPPRLPQAMPYTLLYRTVLEQCRTTEEAVALLEKTPRQTSNNLMIMDAAGHRAVAEISPDGVVVRRGESEPPSALISTNHRRKQDPDTPGRCGRYDYLRRSSQLHFGKIDPERLKSMLATVSQEQSTLQSMIFEPAERVLHLSVGADAARGTFQRFDLKSYFSRP
jgi:isopenicillin-N N-acyltransferase like protein